ncbi:MAG: hypothetical protein JO180_10175 [Gemmatirosa sp.]|nr:hypothetical protein [Gemmatirosa sp.]
MLDTLTADTFAPHVGEPFRLSVDGDHPPYAARLLSVTRASDAVPESRPARLGPVVRHPFNIVLHVATASVLPQRIYRLEHDAIGALDLFLVPVARDAEGVHYEAVFG